jgi:hypothetical protein
MADKLSKKIADWAKEKNVFTNVKPLLEFKASSSYDQAKQSLYDVMNELTGSSPYSASISRFTASAVVPANHKQLERIHASLLPSFYREGSTVLHYDAISGSAAFVSGSFYDIPKGVQHGQTMKVRFDKIEEAFEHKMDQKIAIKKGGMSIAVAAASASLKAVIDAIKAL